ncbi:hypothetical protein INR49_004002 [Caranx melampygus]|nr:hypothetical protein INR49_004002 [Caranx melampygus]
MGPRRTPETAVSGGDGFVHRQPRPRRRGAPDVIELLWKLWLHPSLKVLLQQANRVRQHERVVSGCDAPGTSSHVVRPAVRHQKKQVERKDVKQRTQSQQRSEYLCYPFRKGVSRERFRQCVCGG